MTCDLVNLTRSDLKSHESLSPHPTLPTRGEVILSIPVHALYNHDKTAHLPHLCSLNAYNWLVTSTQHLMDYFDNLHLSGSKMFHHSTIIEYQILSSMSHSENRLMGHLYWDCTQAMMWHVKVGFQVFSGMICPLMGGSHSRLAGTYSGCLSQSNCVSDIWWHCCADL